MEVELVMEDMPEEDYFGVDDNNNDYSDLEGERCGICMDVVIDRGVLDCCQHWFCFSCIDNWATITNLCPLCQNEFQLITCVPVFDTIGSNNADEDLQSRDDDWSIEGKNNTLSFPSYYIDENAVVCLDGDGCKIRSMSTSIEENSNLDTSIACDSCDIWYHAFCVGFDPEGACEDSWLCPRCTVGLMPQKSDEVPVLRPSNQHVPETSSSQCFVDHAFSGKVMISVADAGETAIVVSMLEREKQGVEEQDPKILSNLDLCNGTKLDTGETDIIKENKRTEKPKLEAPSQISESAVDAGETAAIEGNEGTEKGGSKFFPSDCKLDTSSNSSVLTELNTDFFDKAMSTPNVSDGCGTSSNKLSGQLYKNEPLESGLDLHLGFSVVRPLSVDKISSSKLAEDNKVAVHVQQKNNSHEHPLSADEPSILETKKKNVDGISGAKRKHRDWRVAEERGPKARVVSKVLAKKVNAEQSSQLVHPKEKADNSVSEDCRKSPRLVAVSKCRKLKGKSDRKNVTVGIMDIVQGTEQSPPKQPAQANLEESSSLGKRENTTGLRVKKIMRRPTEDKESSMLVQKLRKEIRDAVRNKTSKEHADNLFDPKLLAAFRAAVAAGPLTETKKPPPADLRAKKSLLQKGKVRESLTKKIYGSGGKRRRAWNRDCEIEFWKYRCTQVSKPEKIETLKSVLNLLRKSPENSEIKQGYEKDAPGSSILSRLYLADSSVFPRNDDIKPLSNLKASGIPGQNKEFSSMEKVNFFPSQKKIPAINIEGTKSAVPILKVEEASSSKLLSNRCSEGPSISTLGGSKSNSQNDTTVGKSYDTRTDKRKWAQQFLARKAAVTGKGAAQGQEDTAVLKGSHPLLAQLPRDMLPVLAPSRHNKIPISIRQAQLHRLTEHFLTKANMPVNRRTVEIELAVADAVNIEKGVADRSNSKLVYVNLCSQELLLHNNNRSDTSILSGSRPTEPDPEVHTDNIILEEATNDDLSSCLGVDEALRNAGLLSDSPPNSPPHHQVDEKTEEVDHLKALEEEDGPDNVFEMDAEPELDDIYGDFEYDLEDEDFIGVSSSALTVSEGQPPGEPKLKLVLSKVDSDRSNSVEDSEEPAIVGQPDCSSNVDDKTDRCDNPQSSPFDGGEEELSLAECEELYGPDKEPVIKKFPENEQMIPNNNLAPENHEGSSQTSKASEKDKGTCVKTVAPPTAGGEDEPNQSQKNVSGTEKIPKMDDIRKCPDGCNSVQKKVEAYIKEHIRPLCKSGVITVEQYRWAVGKTTEKIMKYHSKDKNASFLIKEGEKVKKLAEQYVEAAQWTAA